MTAAPLTITGQFHEYGGTSITAQAVDLVGDGHGRHVPGTPDVYSHGWHPLDGTEMGKDGIRRPAKGTAKATAGTVPGKQAGAPPARETRPLAGDKLWQSGEGRVTDVTPAELSAARQWWFGPGTQFTNAYLRGRPNALYPDEKEQVARLAGLVSRAPAFTRPVELHRGIENASDPRLFGPVGSKAGEVFTDPGLMSASADESLSRNGYARADENQVRTVLHIHAPAGSRALRSAPEFFSGDQAAQQDYEAEKEYTFPAGTRMRVLSDTLGQVTDDGVQQKVRTIRVQVEPRPGGAR